MSQKFKYYRIYKPFGMLSQFTGGQGKPTLKDLFSFPNDVYPLGRLDADSEGLLILTNDKSLNSRLLGPDSGTEKEYLVQVEGIPAVESLKSLRTGLMIEGKKTLPAKVEIIPPPDLHPRNPPIRIRKTVPDSWLKIIITEGRNRQVRKMTAKAGFPTLRLIRVRFKNITLGVLSPGEVMELSATELKGLLKL